ncbi:MAG: DUF2167 domain-containing protein [Spirochaetes bacterium]|nr:DUF2167 domain-containing protein [Spirochaetota bacterium]
MHAPIEWATKFVSGEEKGINYNIRYLGRKGVMEVIIVAGEENLDQIIPTAKDILKTYAFSSGNKYSEFVKGDKIADYGLAALIGGGAFAVAAKSGLLAKFWKFIVIGFAAVAGFFKKLFSGFKKKNSPYARSYTPENESTPETNEDDTI